MSQPKNSLSLEQICRDILDIAVKDGLAVMSDDVYNRAPQELSNGDVAGMANHLSDVFTELLLENKPRLCWSEPQDRLTDYERKDFRLLIAQCPFGEYHLIIDKADESAIWFLSSPLVTPTTYNVGTHEPFETEEEAIRSAQNHFEVWMNRGLKPCDSTLFESTANQTGTPS